MQIVASFLVVLKCDKKICKSVTTIELLLEIYGKGGDLVYCANGALSRNNIS